MANEPSLILVFLECKLQPQGHSAFHPPCLLLLQSCSACSISTCPRTLAHAVSDSQNALPCSHSPPLQPPLPSMCSELPLMLHPNPTVLVSGKCANGVTWVSHSCVSITAPNTSSPYNLSWQNFYMFCMMICEFSEVVLHLSCAYF